MKKILLSSLLICSTLIHAQDNSNKENPIKGKLITGGYFTEDNNFETNDLIFADENECKYLGNAKYTFFNKKIQIDLYKKICFENEQVIATDIKGYVLENKEKGMNFSTEIKHNNVIQILYSNKDVEIVLN